MFVFIQVLGLFLCEYFFMSTRIEFYCKNYCDFHGKNYRKHWNRGTPKRSGTFYGAHRKTSRDVTVKISGFKRLVHNSITI